jgi:outer membrane protein OmpA-like peptidoglycan-associated protein
MSHIKRKQLSIASVFTSLALSAGTAWAQPQDVETEPRVSPEARRVIMNDSRNAASAEAASAAIERGVQTPDLDVKSPNVGSLIEEATEAASCGLAELEFEVGSSELTEAGLGQLSPVAKCLQNQPSMRMWLIGHADHQGPDARNWVVGMERALAVTAALRSMGVNPEQLISVSAGATGERSVSFELAAVRSNSSARR